MTVPDRGNIHCERKGFSSKQLHSVGTGGRIAPARDRILNFLPRFLAAGWGEQHPYSNTDSNSDQNRQSSIYAAVVVTANYICGAAHAIRSFIVGIAGTPTQVINAVRKSIPH